MHGLAADLDCAQYPARLRGGDSVVFHFRTPSNKGRIRKGGYAQTAPGSHHSDTVFSASSSIAIASALPLHNHLDDRPHPKNREQALTRSLGERSPTDSSSYSKKSCERAGNRMNR